MPIKISKLVKEGQNTKKTIKIDVLDDTIDLGPLSLREWGEVEDIEAEAIGDIENTQKEVEDRKGFRSKSKKQKAKMRSELKMKMNVKKQVIHSRDAKVRAIYLSAKKFDKDLEEKDIGELAVNIVNEIYEKVREISGVPLDDDEAEEIEKELNEFPEDE